mgnify:CR=1 FL=1
MDNRQRDSKTKAPFLEINTNINESPYKEPCQVTRKDSIQANFNDDFGFNFIETTARDTPRNSKEVFTSRNDKGQLTVRKLTEGTYRWTVKAQSANGTSLTPNISYSFTVLKTEPLMSPVLQVPSSEFVIDSNYLRNNRKINFEWSEVDGATDYLFVLYQVQHLFQLFHTRTQNINLTHHAVALHTHFSSFIHIFLAL